VSWDLLLEAKHFAFEMLQVTFATNRGLVR
jgi:hypothetical protein